MKTKTKAPVKKVTKKATPIQKATPVKKAVTKRQVPEKVKTTPVKTKKLSAIETLALALKKGGTIEMINKEMVKINPNASVKEFKFWVKTGIKLLSELNLITEKNGSYNLKQK